MKKIITNSEQETFDFAKEFAKGLSGGEIIGLSGDLGAGKTIFSKGIGAGLGVTKNITSPTFVVMKVYEVKNHKCIKVFCHIDAYNINIDNFDYLGIHEYISRDDTVIIIEWVDNIIKNLAKKIITIDIMHKQIKERHISIKK